MLGNPNIHSWLVMTALGKSTHSTNIASLSWIRYHCRLLEYSNEQKTQIPHHNGIWYFNVVDRKYERHLLHINVDGLQLGK